MARQDTLGGFELIVLLAVMRLRDEAYGVPIARAIEESSGRAVALGSVYAALERLEEKNFVRSTWGDPTAERGGRARRYFRVTAAGREKAREMQQTLVALWRGLPEMKGGRA